MNSKKKFISNKIICEGNDSFIADYRFKIEKEDEPLNVTLNIVLFLSGQSQCLKDGDRKSKVVLIESQSLALIGIHLQRAIAQIKKFKVLKHISLSFHGFVNKFGQLHAFSVIFSLSLVQKNSAAVVFGNVKKM